LYPWVFPQRRRGRDAVAILTNIAAVKLLTALLLSIAICDFAAAQGVPLPRPRPNVQMPGDAADQAEVPPSACRMRLKTQVAIVRSIAAPEAAGECGIEDAVALEAVVLADKSRIAITPPALLRCTFAEAIVNWVREDLAPAARSLNARLDSLDNYASYDCRGRNRVLGAKISEHGKGNALDVRSLKLANGTVVHLTDTMVPIDLRARLRAQACARFTTVLGPGSDGFHEDHIHVDLAERRSGYRMCQWELREPNEETAPAVSVPLPRPHPARKQPHT
jgi:hypothetical protein